jgi:hypothetical protein
MSETYSVVVTGKIIAGFDTAQVKANVGKALKLNDVQLDKVFCGKPVTIQRGISKQKANKLKAVLTTAGALAALKVYKVAVADTKKPQASVPKVSVTKPVAPSVGAKTQEVKTQAVKSRAVKIPVTKTPVSKAPVTKAPLTKPQATKPSVTKPQVTKPQITKPQITKTTTTTKPTAGIKSVASKPSPVVTPAVTRAQPSASTSSPSTKSVRKVAATQRVAKATAAKPVAKASIGKTAKTEGLICPRCGHEQPLAKACGLCKMDLTLHIQRLKRREQVRKVRRQRRAGVAGS